MYQVKKEYNCKEGKFNQPVINCFIKFIFNHMKHYFIFIMELCLEHQAHMLCIIGKFC